MNKINLNSTLTSCTTGLESNSQISNQLNSSSLTLRSRKVNKTSPQESKSKSSQAILKPYQTKTLNSSINNKKTEITKQMSPE